MAKLYYTSIEIPQDLLRGYEEKSKIDEDMVTYLVKLTGGLTRSEIYEIYLYNNVNVSESSISRSLSNLTDKLILMKTDDKRVGIWGKPNSVYVEVTQDNIEQAKFILKTNSKNIKLKRSEIKLVMSCINFTLINYSKINQKDLPTEMSNQLLDIFKQLKKIK
jgi:predicted transcriptional regulator